jgi:hypothetical protein
MKVSRLAAVLAVALAIGVAGTSWGSAGDPILIGRSNSTSGHAETLLKGGFAATFLQSGGDVLVNRWVSVGGGYRSSGITLSRGTTIGRLTIEAGQRCAATRRPPSNPGDDQSTPMIFTSVDGFHPGVFVAGSEVVGARLRVCLSRPAPADLTVNWVDIDMDTLN